MKAIAVALPDWVNEKKKELALNPSPSLYFMLLPLMQWQDIDRMFNELGPYAAGSGVQLQISELVKELKTMYPSQTLVARLTVSNILREQIFLRIAALEKLDNTLHAYVLRLSPQGTIMSVRTAHL
jgi:hypothetical protein